MATLLRSSLVALAALLVLGHGARAQQNDDQQKCIAAVNSGAAKMGALQGKAGLACLKGAGKGELAGMAQSCLTADTKGRLANQQVKLDTAETKRCSDAPTIAYTSAATAGSSAQVGRRNALADIFGPDLDASVVTCASSSDGCKCQLAIAKAAEKLAATKWVLFNKCKKASLAAGAATGADIEKCLADGMTPGSVAADTKLKLQKQLAKLTDKITKACDEPGVTAISFAAGACSGMSGATLAACIDRNVECRVCQTINDVDGLATDCDTFDDGLANSSCGCSPLSIAVCDDGVACTINDSCGDGVCAGSAIDPDRVAAVNQQIVSTDGMDVVHLSIGVVTKTLEPFQLTATDITFPMGFNLESLSTEACTEEMSMAGPRYRCQHLIQLQATSACEGDGSYSLSLQYSCVPPVSGCSLCGATDVVGFTLDTEYFCF